MLVNRLLWEFIAIYHLVDLYKAFENNIWSAVKHYDTRAVVA